MEIAVGSFLYANGDPVGMVDPTGMISFGSLAVAAAVQGLIGGGISFAITLATTGNVRKSLHSALGGFILGALTAGVTHSIGALLAARYAGTAAAAAGTLDDVFIHGDKLRYLLKIDKGKAKGFEKLGYTLDNSTDLASVLSYSRSLIEHAVKTKVNEWGVTYTVAMSVIGANGRRGLIEVSWIVAPRSRLFKLVTAIPKPFK